MGTKTKIMILSSAGVLFLLLAVPFWQWIPDDAYISFEYARNLATGDGLVFNPGERVEGFSNLLWTLILALAARLGGDIELIARLISMAAALASLGLILALLLPRREAKDSVIEADATPTIAALMIVSGCFFPLAFYATAGLETAFYLLCLLTGAVCHLKAVNRRTVRLHYVSLFAFLAAAMLRPEGVGFLIINVAFLLLRRKRIPMGVLLTGAAVLLGYAAIVVIKYEYFGNIVPNTYFAKPGASWHYLTPLFRGLRYLIRFFVTSGLLLLLPFVFFVPKSRGQRYAWVYLFSFAACQLAFILFVGADILRFDRFAVPLYPWIIGLASLGALGGPQKPYAPSRTALKRTLIVCAALIVLLNGIRVVRAHRKYCVHDWMHARAHCEIGRFLGKVLPQGGGIVANEIGAIRYHSGHAVLDMLGLTDSTVSAIRYESFQTYGIGSSPWSTVSVTRYLFDQDPECVLLPSLEILSLDDKTEHQSTMHPLWYTIFTEPRLDRGYRPICYFQIHPAKFLYVFVRNDVGIELEPSDLPHGRCLESRLIRE
ncbi:MAG: hypothetical protein JSW58_01115 [Candidatus Latescibacterota bacterium]|nr:MAG: hypothetical protein JSW58_01115 [Candidatus Latescibacterota bacterium]